MHHPIKILIVLTSVLSAFSQTASAIHQTQYVIQISIDGLGGRQLNNLMAINPTRYPNFERLVAQGPSTMNARTDASMTFTNPNHASMLTGRPVNPVAGLPDTTHHGLTTNFNFSTIHEAGNPSLSYVTSTFDVAHDYGKRTGFYYSKSKFIGFVNSYNATNGRPDTIGQDNGRNKIDHALYNFNTTTLIDTFITDMTANNSSNPYNYSFIHIADPDVTGHDFGWDSPQWATNLELVDSHIGKIFNLIDNNPVFNKRTILIITADHGGGSDTNPNLNFSHSLPTEINAVQIPFFVVGGGISSEDLYNNITNRTDPLNAIPDYTAPLQPIRNGDAPNMALSLLGLPPIDGSLMDANLIVPVPEPTSLGLLIIMGCLVRRRRPKHG